MKTKKEYEEILKNVMNEVLEGINADGSIKEVQVDMHNKTVTFKFDIVEIPEDDYFGLSGY